MFGPDAGQAGERSCRDFLPLATDEGESQAVGGPCVWAHMDKFVNPVNAHLQEFFRVCKQVSLNLCAAADRMPKMPSGQTHTLICFHSGHSPEDSGAFANNAPLTLNRQVHRVPGRADHGGHLG